MSDMILDIMKQDLFLSSINEIDDYYLFKENKQFNTLCITNEESVRYSNQYTHGVLSDYKILSNIHYFNYCEKNRSEMKRTISINFDINWKETIDETIIVTFQEPIFSINDGKTHLDSVVEAVVKAILSALESFVKAVKELASKIFNWIWNVIKSMMNKVLSPINGWMKNYFTKLLGSIFESFKMLDATGKISQSGLDKMRSLIMEPLIIFSIITIIIIVIGYIIAPFVAPIAGIISSVAFCIQGIIITGLFTKSFSDFIKLLSNPIDGIPTFISSIMGISSSSGRASAFDWTLAILAFISSIISIMAAAILLEDVSTICALGFIFAMVSFILFIIADTYAIQAAGYGTTSADLILYYQAVQGMDFMICLLGGGGLFLGLFDLIDPFYQVKKQLIEKVNAGIAIIGIITTVIGAIALYSGIQEYNDYQKKIDDLKKKG